MELYVLYMYICSTTRQKKTLTNIKRCNYLPNVLLGLFFIKLFRNKKIFF